MNTMREFLNAVINANVNNEITEYAKFQLVKLDEKNERRKNTLTKNQQENNELKAEIIDFMETDKIYTACEIADNFKTTTQKISALLKQLVENGDIVMIDKYRPEGQKNKVKGYTIDKE